MLIRRETPNDHDGIDAVHRAAFAAQNPGAEPIEVELVHRLRSDRGWVPALSLVATDGADAVVGHVIGTVGSVDGVAAIGIGPLGVLPDHQARGIGAALMHAVLGAMDALDYPVAVLLGHQGYYPRFGFRAASTMGIAPTDPSWGDYFQARPLSSWSPDIRGTFRYSSPFEEL